MEGPRLVASAEMPKILEWLGEILGPLDESARESEDCSIALCGRAIQGYTVAVFEADRPISLAHLIMDNLIILGRTLKAAKLTMLITQPERRNQGLASLVLDHCLGLLRQDQVRLLFMPCDRALFHRLGCYPVGIIWTARLRQDELPPPGQAAVKTAAPADLPELHRLYEADDPRWERSPDVFDLADCVPRTGEGRSLRFQPFMVLRAGVPTAYVVIGSPKDEPGEGRIAEYAGDRRSLAGALRIIAARLDLAGLEISVPQHDRLLLERLQAAGGAWRTAAMPGAVGFLDPVGLWREMLPGVAERIGENTARDLHFYEGEDEAFGIRLGREVLVLHDSERLLSLFFGTGPASWNEDHPLPSNLQRVLSSCLPLPLPMPLGITGCAGFGGGC